MIGGLVGGAIDPDVIQGPRIKDAQVQTSNEGVPRPIIYGTGRVAGNVIMSGPLVEHEHEDDGKGGPVQQTYSYTRTYAIRICEAAPLGGECKLRRAWRDDKLVIDYTGAGVIDADSAIIASKLTFFSGSETQSPSSVLEALPAANGGGVGNVPSHRGSCMVVLDSDDLTDRQGTIPQWAFEIASCGTETTGGTIGDVLVTGDGTAPTSSTYAAFTDLPSAWTAVSYLENPTRIAVPCYGDGVWVDVGRQSAMYSTDKVHWASATVPNKGSVVTDCQFNNGLFMAVGTAGVTYACAMRSSGGLAWDQMNHPQVNITSVCGSGRRWITACISNNYYTDDLGDSWDSFTVTGMYTGTVRANSGVFCYGGGTGSAADDPGKILTSPSGIDNWTVKVTTTTAIMGLAAGAPGEWLAVCNNGDVLHTTNDWGGYDTYAGVLPDRGSTVSTACWPLIYTGTYWVYQDTTDTVQYSGTSGALWSGTVDPNVGQIRGLATSKDQFYSSYQIPDAPTYYTDIDGNITGPTVISVTPCTPSLGEIEQDIAARVGVTDLDTTAIDAIEVRGLVLGRQMAASDALASCQQAYFHDLPEYDAQIVAVPRGAASLFDITDDDLVATDADEDTRAQAVEFPRKINLIVSDPDVSYEPVKLTAQRRITNPKAVGESTVELPFSFTRNEAAPIVEKMLQIAWTEAEGRTEFQLPEEFTQMVPSDCFTKDDKRWRATEIEYMDGVVHVKASRDRISAYTSSATSSGVVMPTVPTSNLRGPTVFAAWNSPSLRSQDNVPGIYVAAQGILPGWAGCDCQISYDGGLTWPNVVRITRRATMGVLTADVGTGSSGEPISVAINGGDTLESVTTDQIDAGANACAIVTDNVCEIKQFQTVTEDSGGYFELTDITPGELGTTEADHFNGDQFVLLDENITFIPIDAKYSGVTLYIRPVSLGTVAANNLVYTLVFDPPTFIIDAGTTL